MKEKLRSLRGSEAPAGLGADLVRLLDLPENAQREFWQVLAVYLKPDLDEAGRNTLTSFCERHDVTMEELAPAIRGARFIFDQAAAAGVDGEAFAADVGAAVPEEHAQSLIGLLVPWLEDLVPRLRQERVRQSIADHGKLVVDTRWRVDRITSSDRASAVNTSVAVVTLTYREGDQSERITLHLLPDQLDALRRAADEMLA